MNVDLPSVFAGLIGLSLLAYVVLDGYDLGIGMLMAGATPEEQAVMVAAIGPFWDAYETWLVLGVGLLLVAFPLAHGLILGALYLPIAAMLMGLMFRGAAFELRVKAAGWHRELWNALFWFGSFLTAFAQGLMTGAVGLWVWHDIGRRLRGARAREGGPFAGAVAIFVLAFSGLGYSVFPYVVIDSLTIWEAAAHPSALRIVLIGVSVVLPLIVGYAVYSYYIFRGKANADIYHY